MIEDLVASALLMVAGISTASALRERNRTSAAIIFGSTIIGLGVATAVHYFQAYPVFLLYLFAAAGIGFVVSSIYFMVQR